MMLSWIATCTRQMAFASLISLLSSQVFVQFAYAALDQSSEPTLRYAPQIFNTVQAAMRQWDSSVHHNGMSFFLATVPKGSQFYHGSSRKDRVKGIEWLAFEPEHAMGFARPHPPPPRRDRKHAGPDSDTVDAEQQHPMKMLPGEDEPPGTGPGYLHTYVTKKELRLLYIDGMAAAKSSIGTMDSEDWILLNGTLDSKHFFREYDRAQAMCNMANETWDKKIDGFIRMEAGFEIILCSFEKVDTVRVTAAKFRDARGKDFGRQEHAQYVEAITSRYPGIDKSVVQVKLDHFATAYVYDLDLFVNDSSKPRAAHLPQRLLEPIRRDIQDLVLGHAVSPLNFDWQSVTDRIVTRYADALSFLVQGTTASNATFFQKIEALLQPFIDYEEIESLNNKTLAKTVADRCAQQFVPATAPRSALPGNAIRAVSREICSVLSNLMFPTESGLNLHTGIEAIRTLMDVLAWPAWKTCRGCAVDEICMIPMWPFGDIADYEQPHCRPATDMHWKGDYWGPMQGFRDEH